jgi:DNA-binding CsgD family transcriptional regulator
MPFRISISMKNHLLKDIIKDTLVMFREIEITERTMGSERKEVDLVIVDWDSLDILRDFQRLTPAILVVVAEDMIYFCPVSFGMRAGRILEEREGMRRALWRSNRFLRMVALEDRSEGYGLTRRERDILNLLSLGYCDKEIAGKLHIEVTSVKTHLRNIYRKLGVSGRVEAVLKAMFADGSDPHRPDQGLNPASIPLSNPDHTKG